MEKVDLADEINHYIDVDYLKMYGEELFRADVLPPTLTIYLSSEDREKVEDFILKCQLNQTPKPNYYKYRCDTLGNSVEQNIEYEWQTILRFVENNPNYKNLLLKESDKNVD